MAEIKTEEELLLQNNDTFRDENSDIWKLKGKTRAVEARVFFANIIASVWNVLRGNQQEIDTLQQEVLELSQVVNKPPAAPAGVEWVTEPGITLNDTIVQVDATGVAKWSGVDKPYPAQELPAGAKPADGLIRVDVLYAKSDGTYGLVKGDEGTEGARKAIPGGMLWVRDIIWTSTGGSTSAPETINFNYASYTGKATPADSAVFLVQETSGTKYKWSLSQLIAWLGTKNIGAGSGGTTSLAFTTSLPFDKDYEVDWTITGPTAFTKNTSGFKKVKFIKGNIKADGVNKPTFSSDFIINTFEYINTANKQHRVFFEAQADGKIGVDIVDM